MFYTNSYFYLITIGLQGICLLHSFRRGTQQKWLWVIVFIPIIGSLIYIFTEMFSGRDVSHLQTGIKNTINPGGKIKKLEDNLRFSDTFNNRVALADAYMQTGQFEKAISLYESSLKNNFSENEYVVSRLIVAYFHTGEFEKIIPQAKKIYNAPQFARSKAHIYYTIALDKSGSPELAEEEFKKMNSKFSNFEARYEYARFLERYGHAEESQKILSAIVTEMPHLSSVERRGNREFLQKAKEALKRKTTEAPV